MVEEGGGVGADEGGRGAEAEAGADLGRVDVLGQQLDQRVAVLHHQVVALTLQCRSGRPSCYFYLHMNITRGKSPHYLRLRGFYFGDSNQILNDTSELY